MTAARERAQQVGKDCSHMAETNVLRMACTFCVEVAIRASEERIAALTEAASDLLASLRRAHACATLDDEEACAGCPVDSAIVRAEGVLSVVCRWISAEECAEAREHIQSGTHAHVGCAVHLERK